MRRLTLLLTVLFGLTTGGVARANTVTDWNQTLIDALETAATPPPPAMRAAAIVQGSVYDAVNGIRPGYVPFRVAPAAPPGAARAAAAAGAAHEALVALFPGQQALFDARLSTSLAGIHRSPASITAGLRWGSSVADAILAWRATDGFNTPAPAYLLGTDPGDYQPTPPANGLPQFRQFATMIPFALRSPAQFLPGPPPSLTSRRYARDLAEVHAVGSATSTVRSTLDTQTAIFWQADTPAAMWDRVADTLATQRHQGLLRTARVLALTDIALADATIAIWNAKNTYDRWRPITAINNADTDGNAASEPDPTWTPLLTSPPFQEYPAAHPGVSAAAASVLAAQYGDHTSFTVTSNGLPGAERDFTSFRVAAQQVQDARIFGGIHFRFSTTTGADMGDSIAGYLLGCLMRPLHP